MTLHNSSRRMLKEKQFLDTLAFPRWPRGESAVRKTVECRGIRATCRTEADDLGRIRPIGRYPERSFKMTALRAITYAESLERTKSPGVAYDLATVIRNMADKDLGKQQIPKRERDLSDRIQEQMGGRVALGTYIPLDMKVRDLTSGSATGSALVQDQMDYTFADVLRAASVAGRCGATMLYGIKGNLSTPKITEGAVAEWVVEGVAPGESTATVGHLTFAPNSLSVSFDLTKLLLRQIGPSGEAAFLRRPIGGARGDAGRCAAPRRGRGDPDGA